MKMSLIGIIVLSFFMMSCITYGALFEAKEYDSNKIATINDWIIEFEYQLGSIEETTNIEGNTEVKTQKTNYIAALQLLDDIYFYLLDNGIRISKDKDNVTGFIRITPVYDVLSSQFSSIRIVLYDQSETAIARIKIDNTAGTPTPFGMRVPLNNSKLAIFCGEKIIELFN